jgi:hypothetical protein
MIKYAPIAAGSSSVLARFFQKNPKEIIMRFSVLPVIAFFALALSACASGQTPVSTTGTEVSTGVQAAPTDTLEPAVPTDTPSGPTGSISGKIKPPPVAQPASSIRIYARQKSTAMVFGTEIPVDSTAYTISGLPLGTYTVFAWYYPDGIPGAYTDAGVDVVQTSSDQLKCSNSLVEIVLSEKHPDFQGADISCWAGDYFIYITPMP